MAERLSTGLRDFLLGEGSMRKALEDCVMKIYSGAAPASANDAVTGVLLATITKASGTVSAGERSTPRAYEIVISGTITTGNTVSLNVTVDGVGPTANTYTILAADSTRILIAAKVARMLSDLPQISAIPDIDDATGVIYVQGRIDGLDLTIADVPGTCTTTVTAKQAAARSDAMYFAAPSAGAMSKASETWSGLVATSGVAGYFRFVTSSDDGTLSTTQVRAQGAVSTSGAELNLSNTSLVAATTLTIDTYSISLPAE